MDIFISLSYLLWGWESLRRMVRFQSVTFSLLQLRTAKLFQVKVKNLILPQVNIHSRGMWARYYFGSKCIQLIHSFSFKTFKNKYSILKL